MNKDFSFKLRKANSKIVIFLLIFISFIFQTSTFVLAAEKSAVITEIGSYPTGTSAFEVVVIDDVAFVTDDYEGFFIINVSDPTNPTLINHTYIYQSYEVFIANNRAYIGSFYNGLHIYDLTNLSKPIKIGSFDDGGNTVEIQVIDNYAYIANYVNGFEILNVTDPTNVTKIGEFKEGNFINSMHVIEDVAFVSAFYSNQTSKLIALNISDPALPTPIVYSKQVSDSAVLSYKDGLVFYSSWQDGLTIMDFSDVSNPIELGSYQGSPITTGSYCLDDLLFLGEYTSGLEILDISDLNNPIAIGSYFDGGSATNLLVIDDLIYVADKNDGLEILSYEIQDVTETVNLGWFSLLAISLFLLKYSLKSSSNESSFDIHS
jgi:hypothetical protein